MAKPSTRVEGTFGIQKTFALSPVQKAGLLGGGAAGILLGLQATTQWAAAKLDYQAALGTPAAELAQVPVYWPWSAVQWASVLEEVQPSSTLPSQIYDLSLLAFVVPILFAVGFVSRLRQEHNNRASELHGSAHFAERDDIEKAQLLQPKGIFVGTWLDPVKKLLRYLRHNGPEHVLAFMPTRSGKGIGLILPTLLTWRHSAIITDIKGENWALTSGWRRRIGQRVLKLDFASEDTVRYNFLDPIRIGTKYEVADAQALATYLSDPTGKKADGANSHWVQTSRSLFTGMILHCLYRAQTQGRTACMADLLAELTAPDQDFEERLEGWKTFPHDPHHTQGWTDASGSPTPVHPVVASTAQEQLQRDPKEGASVVSTAVGALSIYADPLLAKNTSVSDFTIEELMHGDKAVSLYLVFRPGDINRLRPILNLLLSQIATRLTADMKFEKGRAKRNYKHRLLMLLDEFPALGRVTPIANALPYAAGFGIKMFLITQDLRQLREAYGQNETITANCHIRVATAPNDPSTAKLLSEMCGTTTVVKKVRSTSTTAGTSTSRNTSLSEQEVARPLLDPGECSRLPMLEKDANGDVISAGEILIFVSGLPVIRGLSMLFFEDPKLLERSQIAAPEPTLFRRADVVAPEPSSSTTAFPMLPGPAPSVGAVPSLKALATADSDGHEIFDAEAIMDGAVNTLGLET